MQRYIVFLNDREVTIHQDINIPFNITGELRVDFTGEAELEAAYRLFCQDSGYKSLVILAGKNFPEACSTFNRMFIRIEAAGGIVRNRRGEYLFIKRLGMWDLPKGKLHQKESVQDGALREVSEETGLTGLSITKKLPSSFHIYTDRKGREVLKETYWFEIFCAGNQKLIPQTEEDITEVKWFQESDLKIPIQNTYASLRHLLESFLPLSK